MAQYRIINAEDAFLAKVDLECVRLYPSKDISEIEYFLDNNNPKTRFRLKNNHRDLGVFEVYGLGEHIALDASLAILAALECMELEEIRQNIQKFCGIKKRFDILSDDECVIIDDYAHHPTEIAATLKSLRKYQELIGNRRKKAGLSGGKPARELIRRWPRRPGSWRYWWWSRSGS